MSKTSALVDSTLTNTQAHVCGQRMQDAKDASSSKSRQLMDSSVQRIRRRMMTQVKSLLTHTSHTQTIARSSTSAWTVLSHVNLAAHLVRSSMMRRNVAMHLRMFQDGKLMWKIRWNVEVTNFKISSSFVTARTGTKKARTKNLSLHFSIYKLLFLLSSISINLCHMLLSPSHFPLSHLSSSQFFQKTFLIVKIARLPIMEIII